MPKRTDLESILIIGSGPIVIGQACEFDYSGTQACRVLRQEGYRVVLANSNPATIMTDPDFADRTYVEPLTPDVLERIVDRERPDAVLPTLGGQTGLNLAMALHEKGLIGCPGTPEMIGANAEAISTMADLNCSRSSAVAMASAFAPIISGVPGQPMSPFSCRAMARLRPVWPPIVGSSASGRSRPSTSATPSTSSGSMYVRSAKPGSVMIVAGFELTTIVRKPSSRSTLSAWEPE